MNDISVNGFSLQIQISGLFFENSVRKENINGANYFVVPHGSEYKIKLSNDRSTKSDADVWVDGEKIGTWRINSFGSITIERPADVGRKFVFFKEGSSSAHSAGIVSGRTDNGLIKVVFRPEKENDCCTDHEGLSCFSKLISRHQQGLFTDRATPFRGISYNNATQSKNDSFEYANAFPSSFMANSFSHGATALGGKSDQEFNSVSSIDNIDTANITTIMARLIVDDSSSKPCVSLQKALHQTSYPARL